MLLTSSFTLLLGAGVALFLAGVNLAFLFQLGGKLVGWFKFKIAAVTTILLYVCLSFSYGAPALNRVIVGWSGLVLDLVAIFWMWTSIERAREGQQIGLVPLFTSPPGKGEKGDQGDPGPEGPRGPKGDKGDPGE